MFPETNASGKSPRFQTTRWTAVLAARDRSDRPGRQAMEFLCRAYWYPLYAYVRRTGCSPEDAQDLTQAFFQRLLARDLLDRAVPEKGRFRSFLLVALKRFMVNEWHKGRAQKRGGGEAHFSIEAAGAEERYALEAAGRASPEALYDRRWALTLVERTLDRLEAEHEAAGRGELFAGLKDFLTAPQGETPYAEAAAALGLSEGAARVAAHRMRKRFRQLFREELAETVTPEKLDEELRHVRDILAG